MVGWLDRWLNGWIGGGWIGPLVPDSFFSCVAECFSHLFCYS